MTAKRDFSYAKVITSFALATTDESPPRIALRLDQADGETLDVVFHQSALPDLAKLYRHLHAHLGTPDQVQE